MSNTFSRRIASRYTMLALPFVVAALVSSSLTLRPTAAADAKVTAHATSGTTAASRQTEMPPALLAAVEKMRYRITLPEHAVASGTYQAPNPAQDLRATFTDSGLRVQPGTAAAEAKSAGGWQWGMSLLSYGYGKRIQPVEPAELVVGDNRIEYRRGTLTEWYVNEPRGIEQGFTLAAPPAGRQSGEPLVLRLGVGGGLRAEVSADAQQIYFVEEGGERVLSYSKLAAFDAEGGRLAARMRVASGEVQLEVDDRGAAYPVTIDPLIGQSATLGGEAGGDRFGSSVAISGDTAIVGANGNDNAGDNAGSAYVFVRGADGTWPQQQTVRLGASIAAESDRFGSSVAISGNTIVVGAPNANRSEGKDDAGRAYVFVRAADGTWPQQQTVRLGASNAAASDNFGSSVAISGNTIVVGAPFANRSGGKDDAGRAYVFVRGADGTWPQQQTVYLGASNAAESDRFGSSVAISGNTIVVGAPNANRSEGKDDAGRAYVFVRAADGTWPQQQTVYLGASNAAESDRFGSSVAISGNTIVVGAPFANRSGGKDDAGRAYVFVRGADGTWPQQQTVYLGASNAAESDRFGSSVAISGNTIVVGAPGKNHPEAHIFNAGGAYVFKRSSNSGPWSEQDRFHGPLDQNQLFGSSVAISGETFVVGMPGSASWEPGVAFVYE